MCFINSYFNLRTVKTSKYFFHHTERSTGPEHQKLNVQSLLHVSCSALTSTTSILVLSVNPIFTTTTSLHDDPKCWHWWAIRPFVLCSMSLLLSWAELPNPNIFECHISFLNPSHHLHLGVWLFISTVVDNGSIMSRATNKSTVLSLCLWSNSSWKQIIPTWIEFTTKYPQVSNSGFAVLS